MPTVNELREQLALRGLPTWGSKLKLNRRLETAIREQQGPTEQKEAVEGNKQTSTGNFQTDKWVMTWNNYPPDVRDILSKNIVPLCKKYVFGFEKGEQGTPHVQGAFILKKKIRQGAIYKLCGYDFYLDRMKGKWSDQNYCKKDGVFMTSDRVIKHPLMDRWWQLKILEEIKGEPDDRTINWYWSDCGNIGKTTFCKYLTDIHGAVPVCGRGNDVRNAICTHLKVEGETPSLVVFPIPRSTGSDYISYEAIENIKDMYFYSGKYEGGAVCGPCPHLYVFANFEPDEDRLSGDRWNIVNID